MDKAQYLINSLKNARDGLQQMLTNTNLKYKIAGSILAAGLGGYVISNILFAKDKIAEAAGDINEKYIVRRIVKRWWVPMISSKLTLWFRTLKTTAEMEAEEARDERAKRRWQYPDNMSLLADLSSPELSPEEAGIPEELFCLYKATKTLGDIHKDDVLALWKQVEIIEVEQGGFVFRIGDPDDQVYILIDGQIDIYAMDDSLKNSGLKIEDTSHLSLNTIFAGQTIYSVLSFIDVLTGHEQPIKTVEAQAVVHSKLYKIPMRVFKNYWFKHPALLNLAIRRFLRRIYQVIFVALHKVMGLSTELTKAGEDRIPINPEFLADTSMTVSEQDRQSALNGAMAYFQLEGPEYYEILNQAYVVILPANFMPVKSGDRTSKFVYVHEGELEVSQRVTYEDSKSRKETDEVLFYVTKGQAIGGLSYLTDDVNIFNVKVIQKVLLVAIDEKILTKLLDKNPFVVGILAHSVISRLSPFAREMDFGLDWTFIESGNTVYKAGDPPIYTYLVLTGRLRSILTDNKNHNSVKGEYGRNDWIGLVETLTKKFRSKTVIAVRDTELARIPDGLLNLIKLKFPIVAMRLLDFLGNRVAKSYRNGFAKQKAARGSATLALIPVSATIPTRVFAYCLKKAYEAFGNVRTGIKVMTIEDIVDTLGDDCLSEDNDYHLTAYLNQFEDRYGLLIFVAEPQPDHPWTRKCIKQADTILLLVNGAIKRDTQVTPIEKRVNELAPRARKELILVHSAENWEDDDAVYPILTRLWLNKRNYISFHHHIAMPSNAFAMLDRTYSEVDEEFNIELTKHSDFSRLCRWLCKTSIGIVLGGGGAKGAAHIGVIRMLCELDIPIDYIAGVSIGAFVAGLYAMTQDIDIVTEMAEDWFDKIAKSYRYFFDITVPHLSLFKGEAFNNSIRSCFGDTQIEDLKIPYFTVSTDMTANRSRVHKSGPLWRYARASMTLSGYFPPICDLDGHFLMDGGYTNLVPANLMRSFGAGWIIGVDVSAMDPIETTNYGDHLSGFRALLPHLLPYVEPFKIPNYFALQQQLSFVQSALYMEIIKEMDRSSIYIRPPLDFYNTSDFPYFKHIMEVGYVYTEQLARRCNANEAIEMTWAKIAQDLATLPDDILAAQATILPTQSERDVEERAQRASDRRRSSRRH